MCYIKTFKPNDVEFICHCQYTISNTYDAIDIIESILTGNSSS